MEGGTKILGPWSQVYVPKMAGSIFPTLYSPGSSSKGILMATLKSFFWPWMGHLAWPTSFAQELYMNGLTRQIGCHREHSHELSVNQKPE